MPVAPIDVAMSEANFQPRGSDQRGSDNKKQGLLQENHCEKSSERVHEKPAKESLISKFKFSKSKPDLNAHEEKIEKEKEKEIKKKTKENEKVEKEKKENERKMEKKIRDEERKISKEKKRETEKKIQEEKKILKEKINIEKKEIEDEIRHVKAEYKRRNKRIEAEIEDFDRRCPKDQHQLVKDGQPLWEMLLRLDEECLYDDALAEYEKNNKIEQLKSKLKALDLQLLMPGEEVLRLSQMTTLDAIFKEQARERLGKSTQIEESVAQPREPAQSDEEEPTKKCTLSVVSQEFNCSMEDNPFYLPGEFKYQKMGEWDFDTCKEWIYDSHDDGLTGPELRHLLFQVKKMPPICGKRMFGATEEEWAQWLGIHGLLIYDKLQKIAEVVKVDV